MPTSRRSHLRQDEERLQHPEEDDESSRLRADGKKRGHRSRRALIDIRHPHLERHRGDLESERDQHQDHAEQRRALSQPPDSANAAVMRARFVSPVTPKIQVMP